MAVRGKANVTEMGTRNTGARTDAIREDVVADEEFAPSLPPAGRRYSLNALIAAGVIGFVAGRVFGR